MSSIGLPGLNGFVSEFFTVQGRSSATTGPRLRRFAATGVVLGAIYMLHMTACVIFGPLKKRRWTTRNARWDMGMGTTNTAGHHGPPPGDLGLREIGILVPLALARCAWDQAGMVTDRCSRRSRRFTTAWNGPSKTPGAAPQHPLRLSRPEAESAVATTEEPRTSKRDLRRVADRSLRSRLAARDFRMTNAFDGSDVT